MDSNVKQLRAKAARHEAERARSIEECDTDGFVSQWAHGKSAELARDRADLEEASGLSEFVGLYQGDRRVKARQVNTRFGTSWLLHEDETALIQERGKPWLPTGPRSRVLAGLGLQERPERAKAYAFLGGSGTGLSGACSVRVMVARDGDKWGENAQLIKEGT